MPAAGKANVCFPVDLTVIPLATAILDWWHVVWAQIIPCFSVKA
jgi:hypothetical protein